MNLKEYKTVHQQRYKELAEAVRHILESAIAQDPQYRLQQIQYRAKSVSSLSDRLRETGQLEAANIEEIRKDLAGCRIVFYTNSDVNRFLQSGIIHQNFDVDGSRSKVHFPVDSSNDANDQFRSHNYVVCLKESRAALAEYGHLAGLWCEVQVQTTLNHAWAEMAHDTIYKSFSTEGFGKRDKEQINKSLDKVMKDYLVPAGYYLDKIAQDARRVQEGKSLLDTDILELTVTAKDNNERFDVIAKLKNDVLPHYDEPNAELPFIRGKLEQAWLLALQADEQEYETIFGYTPGHSAEDVTGLIVEIFSYYRYVDPIATFNSLCKLYRITNIEKSRSQLLEFASTFAAYNLRNWRRGGPADQVRLREMIATVKESKEINPLLIAMLGEMLKPDVTGESSTSKTVSFEFGAISYSDEIEGLRSDAIKLLRDLAEQSTSNDVRLEVLAALSNAYKFPRHPEYAYDVVAMIVRGAREAADAGWCVVDKSAFRLKMKFEKRLFYCFDSIGRLPADMQQDPSVADSRIKFLSIAKEFSDQLNACEEYVVFKTLIGFDSIPQQKWLVGTDEPASIYRLQDLEVKRLADQVNDDNWAIWQERIMRLSNEGRTDLGAISHLIGFIKIVIDQSPQFGLLLIDTADKLPSPIVTTILGSLLTSNQSDRTLEIISEWISNAQHLQETARALQGKGLGNSEIVERLVERSIDEGCLLAIALLMDMAVRRYSEDPSFWTDKVFMLCLRFSKENGSFMWVRYTGFAAYENGLFHALDDAKAQEVLESIVEVDKIEHEADAIIAVIAARLPTKVLDFYLSRISEQRNRSAFEFDAVPYNFGRTGEILKQTPSQLIQYLLASEYANMDVLPWDVSHLISRIDPEFGDPLSEAILEAANASDGPRLRFILNILFGYEGNHKVLSFLRRIVPNEFFDEDAMVLAEAILWETGCTVGEYGQSEAYEERARSLEDWVSDENLKVRDFASDQVRRLNQMALSMRADAESSIAMRRLNFGESPVDSSSGEDGEE